MSSINFKVTGALCFYFETLHDLNLNLIKCCGADIIDDYYTEYDRLSQQIIRDIPKLIPYIKDKKTGELKLTKKDGLLEFSAELPYLEGAYQKILRENNIFLDKVKSIRNKLEHKMHEVQQSACGNDPFSLFRISYTVEGQEITLYSNEFIEFAKQINILFSNIQKNVDWFMLENGLDGHAYYERLIRYNFCNFNRIYESDLLRIFGQSLFPF